MGFVTPSKIAIGYGNLTPGSTASIAGCTAQAGFPASNLEYEDPWTLFKTGTITGTPTLTIDVGSTKTINCVGLLNHNLSEAGYTSVEVRWWDGSWGSHGTFSLDTDILGNGDDDIFVATATQTGSKAEIKLTPASQGNFFLGSIFWGEYLELGINPLDGLFTMDQASNISFESSSGGAKHMSIGNNKKSISLNAVFSRIGSNDVDVFRRFDRGSMIGILPPEQAADAPDAPRGTPHFWGYITNMRTAPRSTLTAEHKYDLILDAEGAV